MARGNVNPSWPELLGSERWDGLLDPLNLSLRHLILRCGDLTQVTYDAFDDDAHSKYCGSSRYGPAHLLDRAMFPFAAEYNVAAFLYATSEIDLPPAFLLFSLSDQAWSKDSNWIGYVAVSSDSAAQATGRRDIVVAWRGTIRDLEWVDVLQPELVPIDPLLSSAAAADETPMVMKGWYTIYTSSNENSTFNKHSARDQLLNSIKKLVDLYKHESLSILCVGHSLGASLAILSAFDLVENGIAADIPVCAIVFGNPQVGNKAFNARMEQHLNLRVLGVKNKIDLIPLYPTKLLGFENSGEELVVDGRKSPYLKESVNPSDWHNLQGILHAVAGWNGEDGKFEMRVKRSVGLVNKSSDYLKDDCLIPASWWVEKNNGMVRGPDGEWQLAPPDEADIPVPPTLTAAAAGAHQVAPAKPVDSPRKSFPLDKLVSCFRTVN